MENKDNKKFLLSKNQCKALNISISTFLLLTLFQKIIPSQKIKNIFISIFNFIRNCFKTLNIFIGKLFTNFWEYLSSLGFFNIFIDITYIIFIYIIISYTTTKSNKNNYKKAFSGGLSLVSLSILYYFFNCIDFGILNLFIINVSFVIGMFIIFNNYFEYTDYNKKETNNTLNIKEKLKRLIDLELILKIIIGIILLYSLILFTKYIFSYNFMIILE